MSEALKAPQLGTTLGERYTLLRFLGHGAMGAVYEASTPGGDRFAVKVLLELGQHQLAAELEKRFVREAAVSSTFESEHVVPALDSGMDETLGVPYLVMPLLVGFDASTLLERAGALHPTVAVRIIAQACSGLMEAHKDQVVHRDIKPDNIFLDHHPDGSVTARVLDFGMAKLTEESSEPGQQLTRAGSILGTPHYMSPEQSMNAKDVDARCDVWGIAATLYHLLTGCAPFAEARTFADLHMSLNTADVPWIQDRAPWIDPGLACVVHGSLLRDRSVRCESMSALRTALLPFLVGSTELNAMMLEPLPAVLRRARAPRAERPASWDPGAPSGKLPPISSAPVDEMLGKRLGEYRLLRGLGASPGLYEAIGGDANRYAVRVVPTHDGGAVDAAAASRFVREARALASIDNDHVLKLVDAAYDEELAQPYAVLELLYGRDLRHLVAKHGAIDPLVLRPLMIQLCRGLDAAHRNKIIHREVTPSHVFLVEEPGGEVRVKLVGFGRVKRLPEAGEGAHDVTRGGEMIGSPMYMAPEQARDATKVDERSDVYGVGATMFNALCGAPPWPEGLTGADLLLEMARGRPRHLQDLAPWVDRDLVEIVHRAMKPNPAERFATAIELMQALARPGQPDVVRWSEIGPIASDRKKRVAPRAEPIVPEPAPPPAASGAGALAPSIPEAQPFRDDSSHEIAPADVSQRLAPPQPAAPPQRLWLALAVIALVCAAAALGWFAGAR